jgi:hypothetical protein
MTQETVRLLILLILPTLVVVVAALILMNWRIPTRVQVVATVNRALFTVGGSDSQAVLNSVGFQSITAERFVDVKLSPERLEVADPGQYIKAEDRYPDSSWSPVEITSPIVITGENETLQPAITLESTKPGQSIAGVLDRVWVDSGSQVTLALRGNHTADFTIKVDGQKSSATLSLRKPFQLITNYAILSGIKTSLYQADSLTYKGQLPNHSPLVEITGHPRSFVLDLTIVLESATNLFYKGGILVTSLDFTSQGPKGESLTTLVKDKDGEITYPDYPKIGKVSFKAPDFINLADLDRFQIEQIAPDPKYNGFRINLVGVAGQVRTGTQGYSKDHRLTIFDSFWQNQRLIVLFSIVVWVFGTTLAGYKLIKELKG